MKQWGAHVQAVEGHEGGAPPLCPVQVVHERCGHIVSLYDHVEQLIARRHLRHPHQDVQA